MDTMNTQTTIPDWANVRPAPGIRHLPVYLLLDTSESMGRMGGAPLEAIRVGLEQFQREASEDSFARDVVVVGVITFNEEARLAPDKLIPISAFQPPSLKAGGRTRLDLAFNVLLLSMDRDVLKAVEGGQKGDWRPVVFILTDGRPTDEEGNESDKFWPSARKTIVDRPTGQIKPSCIIAVGCGPDVDDATLTAISTGPAFRMDSTAAAFVALFQYITQSIVHSVQAGGNPNDPLADITLPKELFRLPGGMS